MLGQNPSHDSFAPLLARIEHTRKLVGRRVERRLTDRQRRKRARAELAELAKAMTAARTDLSAPALWKLARRPRRDFRRIRAELTEKGWILEVKRGASRRWERHATAGLLSELLLGLVEILLGDILHEVYEPAITEMLNKEVSFLNLVRRKR